MKIIQSERAWSNLLIRRRINQTWNQSQFAAGAKLDIYEEDLRLKRYRSPGSWAVAVNTCAIALNMICSGKTKEQQEAISGRIHWSADRIIKILTACAINAKIGHARYAAQGINSQPEITINPYLERARKAIEKYRSCYMRCAEKIDRKLDR